MCIYYIYKYIRTNRARGGQMTELLSGSSQGPKVVQSQVVRSVHAGVTTADPAQRQDNIMVIERYICTYLHTDIYLYINEYFQIPGRMGTRFSPPSLLKGKGFEREKYIYIYMYIYIYIVVLVTVQVSQICPCTFQGHARS